MDREGSVLRRIGPIRDAPQSVASRPPQAISTSMNLAMVGDSQVFGPLRIVGEPDAWVGSWSEEGVEPLVYAEDVGDILGPLPDGFREPLSGGVIQLTSGDDGGAWAVARVRAVSDCAAQQIQDEVYQEAGSEPRSNPRNDPSPPVANRVNRTLIFRIDPDGQVTEAALAHDAPRGFVDPQSFFSLEETEEGLLQVRIRGFSRHCDDGSPQ